MKFSEFRQLSEATKDLISAIGSDKTSALLKKKVLSPIQSHHDKVFGKGNNHLEFPLENDMPHHVINHIESNGDSLTENGVKLKSGREVPVSKYLAKSGAPKNVTDEHQNWERNKVANSKLVITRNPAEVASASTGTHWSSCANPNSDSGVTPAWDAMPHEIKHGTLMAMHVHKDAKVNEHGEYNSKDILGRTLIKHHVPDDVESNPENKKEITFHREQRQYGAFPESANKVVDEFTKKHYPQTNLLSKKHEDLYNDDNSPIKVNMDHSDVQHVFTRGHEKELAGHIQTSIVGHAKAGNKIIELAANSQHISTKSVAAKRTDDPKILHKIFHSENDTGMYSHIKSVMQNPHVPHELVDAGIHHKEDDVRGAAASSPMATSSHLDIALKDHNSNVRYAAASNPNTTSHHIEVASKDVDPYVRKVAVESKHATSEHIAAAINDHKMVKMAALSHKNVTPEHITTALKDKDSDVRRKAISNPNATTAHIDIAMKDKSEDVRHDTVSHTKATAAHIDKALTDKSVYVRQGAMYNNNATAEHIHKGLNDTSSHVRYAAITNKNVDATHIDKALDTRGDMAVKCAAAEHAKATPTLLHKALDDFYTPVRMAATANPNATKDVLKRASKDDDSNIRFIANRRLNDGDHK